ncbi:hypothetical protein [Azohydromonas sediminis]|uniref:hypothetical protein n=1 Tax=Azohydromonas sediminis TaxID=2259674 RepID=UPI0013C3349B|nr:hypothetical protein [Azohydromonas sediminis]
MQQPCFTTLDALHGLPGRLQASVACIAAAQRVASEFSPHDPTVPDHLVAELHRRAMNLLPAWTPSPFTSQANFEHTVVALYRRTRSLIYAETASRGRLGHAPQVISLPARRMEAAAVLTVSVVYLLALDKLGSGRVHLSPVPDIPAGLRAEDGPTNLTR